MTWSVARAVSVDSFLAMLPTTRDSSPPGGRARIRTLFLALVSSLCATALVFGALFWLSVAPLLRQEDSRAIAASLSVLGLGPIVMGWFWARPRIPYRDAAVSVETFWQGSEPTLRALLAWGLWEGGAIIGVIGALLTGDLLPAGTGLLGLALLVTHGPGYLESRRP
jgi:hypothetical protein